ncbi:acyltransferase [Mucilaginibacter sp. PAMB04168]|uniref:acyltransferase n=1 Tax=Mucilaginibacter sp. PAMB04168 TaxID=3138567 RepID=UPI0031F704EA
MALSGIVDAFLIKVKVKLDNKINFINKQKLLKYAPNLSIGDGFRFDFKKNAIEIDPKAYVQIKNDVRFREFCNIMVYKDASLILEDSVHFNRYCSINCLGNIRIGKYTIFGEGVKLYDHNHIYENVDSIIQNEPCKIGHITIGSNCWIGANVTILNNVTIGDNVVIGAGNLIFKDVPSNVLVKNRTEAIVQVRN